MIDLDEVQKLLDGVDGCLNLLDGLVAESGRGVEWGEEDAFRMGEWFEDHDIALIAATRAAARQLVPDMAAEIAALRTENEFMKTCGVIEMMVRNPNVNSFVAEWEGRAIKAEAEVARLKLESDNLCQIERNVQSVREHEHKRAEAALAEVVRLSTPPDDAEADRMTRRLRERAYFTRDAGHFDDAELDERVADALTRLSHALAAETAKREAMEEALRFYADENRFGLPSDGPWGAGSTDFGRMARETLAKHGSKT